MNPLKRHVLFVDHTASLGGGEIALLNLVANLDRNQFEPIVLLFSDGPLVKRLRETQTQVHVLPLAANVVHARKDNLGFTTLMRLPAVLNSIAFVWRLKRFIKENKVDLVHTNSLKSDVLAGLAARLARVPLIWHIRDRIETDYLPRHVVYLFRWLCRLVPDFVVANSAATLSTVGLDQPERGMAIPSGIDLRSRVVHDGMNSHFESQFPDGFLEDVPRIVGLVGRISPWKGQHIFLQAAASVHRRFPDVRFQIIGTALFNEQDYQRQIRQLSTDLGLDHCVEFLGFRDDVSTLISKMEILVHASVTAEPFGQVVTEGMAAGKPVVATAGGGVLEIVVDGVTGLLVTMGDAEAMSTAICQLLDDPEAALRMGQVGRQRVLDQFAIKNTVAKIQRVYDEVLAMRRNARSLNHKHNVSFRESGTFAALASLAIVAITFVITETLHWWFGEHAPISALFVGAVVISSQFFGVRAGLLATACSVIAMAYVLPPNYSWAVDKGYQPVLIFFVIVSLVIVPLIGRLRSAEVRAKMAQLAAEKARQESEFISRVAAVFAMCPSGKSLLQAIGRLANSMLSDWCIIDLIASDQIIHRVFAAHRDVSKYPLTEQLCALELKNSDGPAVKSIRSQAAICLDSFNETSNSGEFEQEVNNIMKQLGSGPAIIVPLNTAGQTIGAISLIRDPQSAPFASEHLKLATEFAWRAAIALERFHETQLLQTANNKLTGNTMKIGKKALQPVEFPA